MPPRSHGFSPVESGFLTEKPWGRGAALCSAGLGQASTRQSPPGTNHRLISPTRFPHTQESHSSLPRGKHSGMQAGGEKEDLPPPPGHPFLADVHEAPGSILTRRPAAQGTALRVPHPTRVLPSVSKERLKHTRLLSGRRVAEGPILPARRFGVHGLGANRIKRNNRRQRPHLQGKVDDTGG